MVAASAVIRPTFGAPSGMSYWFAKGRAQSIIRLLTETFFVLIVTAVRADGNGRMATAERERPRQPLWYSRVAHS